MAPHQQEQQITMNALEDAFNNEDSLVITDDLFEECAGNIQHYRSPSMMIVVKLEEGEEDPSNEDFETSYYDFFPDAIKDQTKSDDNERDGLVESPRSVIPNLASLNGSIPSLTDLIQNKTTMVVTNGKRSHAHRRAQNRALSGKEFERNVFPYLIDKDFNHAINKEGTDASRSSRKEACRKKQKALVLEDLAFPIVLNEASEY